jgi:hypothetical protein
MTLTTIADVRELVERHLPAECQRRETWRYVVRLMRLPTAATSRMS